MSQVLLYLYILPIFFLFEFFPYERGARLEEKNLTILNYMSM